MFSKIGLRNKNIILSLAPTLTLYRHGGLPTTSAHHVRHRLGPPLRPLPRPPIAGGLSLAALGPHHAHGEQRAAGDARHQLSSVSYHIYLSLII